MSTKGQLIAAPIEHASALTAALDRSTDFRPDINGLRSIAVATVVLFHFGVPGFRGGFVGVDVFFVISGFLMTKIIVEKLWTGRFSVFDFYLARARRIFPALAALCLVLLALGAVSLSPVDYQRVARWSASSLTFLSNFTFLGEAGYFDTASAEKWLLHTWSLSVEWQFYLLFPLLLLIAWKAFPNRLVTAATIGAAFLCSLGISIYWSPRHVDAAYFLLPTRAWEMMAGALAYLATPHLHPKRGASTTLELTGLALILFAAIAFKSTDPWPGHLALFPVLGSVLVIMARNTRSIVTTNPVADFIGTSSYSIYLWHWPVATALTLRGLKEDWAWAAVGIGLAIALGHLSYRLVEVTSRDWRRLRRSSEWLGYAAAASLLVTCSLLIAYDAGMPSRLGSDEKLYEATAAAISDWSQPGCVPLGSLRYCERPGTDRRTIMFVGDSIAEQWYPRYAATSGAAGPTVVFATRPGCTPIRNLDGYPPNVHCGESAAEIWDTVRRVKPEELVVSSQWWENFFMPSAEMRRETCVISVSGCRLITDVSQLKQALAALQSDIAEATSRGTNVVVLGPPPYSNLNYADLRLGELASRHLPLAFVKTWQTLPGEERQSIKAELATLTDANSETPEFPWSEDRPEQTMEGLLRDVAARSGARFVPLEDFMCPDGLCPLTDPSGVPIYADHLHLRAHYVQSASLRWLDSVVGKL